MNTVTEREYLKDGFGRTVLNKLYSSDGREYIPDDKYTIDSDEAEDLLTDDTIIHEIELITYTGVDGKVITKNVYEHLDNFMKSCYLPDFHYEDNDFVKELCTGNLYVYVNVGKYGTFSKVINAKEPESHPIKISKCTNCGANLDIDNINNKGIVHCEYCNSKIYVW